MMLIKRFCPCNLYSLRYFSSLTPHVLKPGDTLKQTRIFSGEDILEFSKVTHDTNPLHFNSEVAQGVGFEDRIVHGMLVAALFPRIISSHFPGAIYISQSLHFKLPVYIGDEIVGEVQALNIREYKKKQYIAKFLSRCFRNGDLVLDGEAMAILPTLEVEQVHPVS